MSLSGNVSRSASCPCAKNQAAKRLSGAQQYSKSLTIFVSVDRIDAALDLVIMPQINRTSSRHVHR
eukprot:2758435-Heterocapsa_arctica.AAC.1